MTVCLSVRINEVFLRASFNHEPCYVSDFFCFFAELTVKFGKTILTVSEDVGEVIVTVSMIGNTNVPITVDVVFSGIANEAEGNGNYTATFFVA